PRGHQVPASRHQTSGCGVVNWPSVARNAATTSVAAGAAVVSYHHQVKVASAVGEDRAVALILPLSVDGLMVVAGMAMFKDKKHWQARGAVALGIRASVAGATSP